MSKRKGGTVCVVRDCPSRTINKDIVLFRFPKEQQRAHTWLMLCYREDLMVVVKEEYGLLDPKEEPYEAESVQNEEDYNTVDFPDNNTHRYCEEYLKTHPNILREVCGFSDVASFEALLDYVETDMPTVKGITKYEQLAGILAKLCNDDDTAVLNSSVFPIVYVKVVEILYQKLNVLYKNSTESSPLPSVFLPEFDPTQRVVIIGFLVVSIRSTFEKFPENFHTVKYLVAYSPFGEVFFVSNPFVESVSNLGLIVSCGLLKNVKADDWILFCENSCIYIAQVGQVSLKNKHKLKQLNSAPIAEHMSKVVGRVEEHFKVLQGFIPDFMLQDQNGVCFLDKLVFVCCMLLNMLSRVVYS